MENMKLGISKIGVEEVKVTSLDLVDKINEFRLAEGKKTVLQHNDFMKKIRKELEQIKPIPSSYLDQKNQSRPCYELTKDGLKYLIDITKSSDRIPMQKVYEEIGGDYSKVYCIDRFENTFFNKLKDTLSALNIEVETQYSILNYRLDGYIASYKLFIEYDEAQHFVEPQKSIDIKRQHIIENNMDCKFVRLNYKDTDAYNVGLVIKKIMEEK